MLDFDGFCKYNHTWFLKFIEMQILWLLGIIIRNYSYWILHIKYNFFSKKAIKGNLCRIGRSAKSALISWLMLTAWQILMKPKSIYLCVRSTNFMPLVGERHFICLVRGQAEQVSDCWVVTNVDCLVIRVGKLTFFYPVSRACLVVKVISRYPNMK